MQLFPWDYFPLKRQLHRYFLPIIRGKHSHSDTQSIISDFVLGTVENPNIKLPKTKVNYFILSSSMFATQSYYTINNAHSYMTFLLLAKDSIIRLNYNRELQEKSTKF